MINKINSWQLVKLNAQKALTTQMIYHSLVDKRAYQVLSVTDDKIIIVRVSGGENDELTKKIVANAIEKFNTAGGKIKRRTLISPTVAKETALVLFHPNLSWDETGEFIVEVQG